MVTKAYLRASEDSTLVPSKKFTPSEQELRQPTMSSKSNKRMRRQRKPCAQAIYELSSNHPIQIPNKLGSPYFRDSPKTISPQLSSSCQLKRQTPLPLDKISRFGNYIYWICTWQSMTMTSSSIIVMNLLKLLPSFYPYQPQKATS